MTAIEQWQLTRLAREAAAAGRSIDHIAEQVRQHEQGERAEPYPNVIAMLRAHVDSVAKLMLALDQKRREETGA